MRQLLVLFGVIAALGALYPFGATSPSIVSAQEATPEGEAIAITVARTDAHLVIPFGPDGLDPDLATTGNVTGVCGFSSLMATGRADAWDCLGDDDQVYDPCFENPFAPPEEPGELACFASPFTGEVVLLTLDEPLVRDKEMASDSAVHPFDLPWAVELANGERCTLLSEIDVVIAGQAVYFACDGGGEILGTVDRSFPVWTVNYLADGATETTLTEVVAAWS